MNEVEIVVKARDDTAAGFDGARRGVARLKDSLTGFGNQFGSITKNLMARVAEGVMKGASQTQEAFHKVFTGGISGALSSGPIGLIIVGALVAAIGAAAPLIATAIAGALALGFGAAFVGVGAMILLQNEKLQEKIGKSWEKISGILQKAFAPLIPVIDFVMKIMADLAKQFAPVIKQASELAAGPLKGFIKELSEAFLALKPAIAPLMEAFTAIIGSMGPMLKDVFISISDSLIELADAVIENKDVIAAMFTAVLYIIPRVIDVVRVLTNVFGSMMRFMAFEVAPRAISAVNSIKSGWNTLVSAVSSIVARVKSFFSGLISFVAGLPGKVSSTASRMFTSISTAASNIVSRARSILNGIISFVRGLPGQIASAASGMFNGIVNAARNAVSQAAAAIRSIPSRIGGALGFAHGGVIGAAGGGPRSGMTLVGEAGPELVNLPAGSRVIPNGRTEQMLAGSGGDGGVTVNLYVQGSIRSDRDLVKIIRDEFINGGFRGAVTTS